MDTSNRVQITIQGRDDASAAFEKVSRGLEGIKSSIRGVAEIGAGTLLGNLGVQGLDAVVGKLKDFGAGMIDANSQIELMRQRLNILYQSATEGAQAFAFLKQNELTKPFDIQSILQASVQLVAFKQDITTVLPALEDVAGAMGQSLPTAAQAFTDAMAGRFAMMKRDLGISKEELVQFGLQMNKTGHVTDPNSFVSAFLALANSDKFKGGADKLAQTWTGLMSSMSSQWMYFQANLGRGAFQVLEQQLGNLVHTLQNPANAAAIQQFELALGAGLGQATAAAINFGRALGPYVGSAIALVARAWPLVTQGASAAFGLLGRVVSSFATWLQGTGYPAITAVLSAIAEAWQAIYPVATNVLSSLVADFSGFAGAVAGISGGLFQGLAGAFQIGMGAAEAIFGGALTLLSGDWAGFQNDISDGANVIVKGLVGMVGGASIALLPLANSLLGPWTAMAQGIRSIFSSLAPFVGTAVAAVALMASAGINGLILPINATIAAINAGVRAATGAIDALIDKYNGLVGLIPGLGGARISKIGGAGTIPTVPVTPLDLGTFQHLNAQIQAAMRGVGIGPGQQIVAGRSEAAAAADIRAAQQRILGELGLGGDKASGRSFSASSAAGQAILGQIKALFANLGGTFTMKDLMEVLGIKDLGKGVLAYAPPAGGLPVPGAGPTADQTGATGGAAGLGAALRTPTGRVPLGALGAVFMQTLATTGALHAGTDPATRAAQRQAEQGRAMVAQGDKHTVLLQQHSSLLTDTVKRLDALLVALAKAGLPAPTPPNPLQGRGVHRPRVA